jgi:hypothetical protein
MFVYGAKSVMHTFVSVCVNSNFGVNISILPENQNKLIQTSLHIICNLQFINHITNHAISTQEYEIGAK